MSHVPLTAILALVTLVGPQIGWMAPAPNVAVGTPTSQVKGPTPLRVIGFVYYPAFVAARDLRIDLGLMVPPSPAIELYYDLGIFEQATR